MKHSTGTPTKAEQQHLNTLAKMGCVACASVGVSTLEVEIHHILEGNKRLGHLYTLPLCAGHHRDEWCERLEKMLTEREKVSIANGRKAFANVYGTERQLWERINEVLGISTDWPASKIVPRRVA